ncbi:MAG: CsgG/HfaB family protein [Bacteroidota bacterium]|nr:CsgG/HfaB family protein [Bacteroidota bacterium]
MKRKIIIGIFVSLFMFISFSYSQTTIAVLQLRAKGISEMEAEVLTERLRSHLVNLNQFQVLDRENMNSILEEQGFQLSGCTSSKCMIEAGQLLGVEFMISGSVGKFGTIFTIDLRKIDIGSGEIAKTSSYDFKGEMENLLTEGINTALIRLLGNKEQKEKLTTTSQVKETTTQPKTVEDDKSIHEKLLTDSTNMGYLNASIMPKFSEVDIDNVSTSVEKAKNYSLPAGKHKIKVFAKDYSTFSDKFKIIEGEITSMTITLEELNGNQQLVKFRKKRKRGIILSSVFWSTTLFSAGMEGSNYDKYENAQTSDSAKEYREKTETWGSIRNLSAVVAISFSASTIYNHIKIKKIITKK